jgi:pyruvate dehydrogenase E2 component (dihydrolipoamide acetyltransferase)
MATEVILPKVDMDMATGRISKWLVDEGAVVKQGDAIFEIETDKAAMEVEAPASGTLKNIIGKVGEDVAVGKPVAWIYADGEAAGAAPVAQAASAAAAPVAAQKPAEAPASVSVAIVSNNAGDIRATPLARRVARQAGIDLSKVIGTGPHGRIQRADVDAVLASPSSAQGQVEVRTIINPTEQDERTRAFFAPDSYDEVPHDSMRKTIARRLLESKQTVPHFYVTADIELDALLKAREEINASAPKGADGKPAYKLSVNDFIIKALAVALIRVPDANVTWTESAMLKHKHADVGVAVSIPGGLITPVVRKAELKSLSAISTEMKDLAARARNRKLKPEEYQGGTTAVSNLGMFGVKEFAAIVNPPHATILAVGAGEQRPVVKNGQLAVATVMTVTFSTDHRAVDGALGAELLAAFKSLIENPVSMLV